MIHFVHGPDRLLARKAATAIAREADPDGIATSWLDGKQTTIERIIADVGTRSFFSGPRVIVVTDLIAGRGTTSNDTAERGKGKRSQANTEIVRLLESVPEDHHLILLEADLTGPPALLKSASVPITVVSAEPPRGPALLAWIADTARQSGTDIEPAAARELARVLFPQSWERKPTNPRYDVPPDLTHLSQEIEKLAVAAHPGHITIDHVRSLVAVSADPRLFRFVEAAMAGDLHGALPELQQLQLGNEEPAMLLAQLLGQIEISAVVAASGSRDAATVAKDLGTVTPGRVSAVAAASKRHPAAAMAGVTIGATVDRDLKTGRVRRPEDAIHSLLLGLAGRSKASSRPV